MAINKDPAFLFYSKDFITSTQTMDWEERGKLSYLLAIMHQEGRLTEKTLGFILGIVPDAIRAKLKQDENGLWYNEQLEQVIAARAKFISAARENGKKGGRPGKDKEKKIIEEKKPNQNPIQKEEKNHNKEMELELKIDNLKNETENLENPNFEFNELNKSISHQTVEPLLEKLPTSVREALDKLFLGKKWRHKTPIVLKENIERCKQYEESFVVQLIETARLSDWSGIFYDNIDLKYENWKKNKGDNENPNLINGINFE